MIKTLLARMNLLPLPPNYFSGARIPAPNDLELPDNILIFQRRGLLSAQAPIMHHRFLLSMNMMHSCDIILDSVRFTIQAGQAILIYPHQHHMFFHNHPEMARLMVSFEIKRGAILLPPQNRVFSIAQEESGIVALLLKAYLDGPDPIVCSLLTAILLRTLQGQDHFEFGPIRKERKTKLMDEVILFIQRNLEKPLSIETLARKFNMSASHLRLRFRQSFGLSIGLYLSEARLHRSMSYLGECDMRIEEIASKCGYGSTCAFDHSFKKHMGISPAKYRRFCRGTLTGIEWTPPQRQAFSIM